MTTLAHPEILTDIEVQEILSRRPVCEGENHTRGTYGHHPEQSASWLIGMPCGISWLMCDGWVQACLHRYNRLVCVCGTKHQIDSLTFIPLGRDDA